MATHSSVLAWRIPGTGSLVGCHLWGRTESDMTEAMQQQQTNNFTHIADSSWLEKRHWWHLMKKCMMHNSSIWGHWKEFWKIWLFLFNFYWAILLFLSLTFCLLFPSPSWRKISEQIKTYWPWGQGGMFPGLHFWPFWYLNSKDTFFFQSKTEKKVPKAPQIIKIMDKNIMHKKSK